MAQYRTISLPDDLCTEAEKQLAGRFDNFEDLLSFLLREIIRGDSSKFDRAEEQIIEQRLRDLGYM